MRAAKVQVRLRIRAVSPEPSLLAHTSSESRGTFRQKTRSLAPLNGWACAVKICHDGMLEDTNSLDAAHFIMHSKILQTSLWERQAKALQIWQQIIGKEIHCKKNLFNKDAKKSRLQDFHILDLQVITTVCPKLIQLISSAGHGSSIESAFAWHASCPEFDHHAQHILSWRLGHENISTAILPLPLIQEQQLSVTGERMCTKYW